MSQKKQLNIRISKELYDEAKRKCEGSFDIPLSNLVKIFLRAFIAQKGIGFWVGDDDLSW